MKVPPKTHVKDVWVSTSLPKRTVYTGKVSGRIYRIQSTALWADPRDVKADSVFVVIEPETLPSKTAIASENEPLIISSDTVSYDAKPTAKKAKKSDDDPTYLD